ncbi:SDR family NAD(P)-dependent oxidoreductase [Nonomuraea africana]|uniref:NAD(P)-dependent dehydrogenase (Short-subunit alcohol dehydrogenase family) n=1 Tax=Nonomuraea africana TaxID=46171 RepID=A0ABR9K803_9ACTN|nr:SDR family oxidoreductase [Nonomuraea africana]MBE1557940.1 NAD(P)-dependent dehydrogenase (short-subunit alcohol dehydrogenase family) [Nonomuraea africana]
MATPLTGRVAVITGGPADVAATFRSLGAVCATCDRRKGASGSEGNDRGKNGRELAMTLDLRDPMAVDVFATAVHERYGRVDILVTNAAATTGAPFERVSARAEHALIEENFTQVTGLIRRMLPLMGRGSAIVNLVQDAPRHALDAALKAAVESLSSALAVELAPRGISVHATTVENATKAETAYQLWCSGMPSV